MDNGHLLAKPPFTRQAAEAFTKDMWVRLGMDPHDPTTWDRERVHMPALRREPVATFAPRVRVSVAWAHRASTDGMWAI